MGISFRGCIRNIERDYKPLDLKGTDFTSKDIQVGTCGLLDRYIISEISFRLISSKDTLVVQ